MPAKASTTDAAPVNAPVAVAGFRAPEYGPVDVGTGGSSSMHPYELATDVSLPLRLAAASSELALAL